MATTARPPVQEHCAALESRRAVGFRVLFAPLPPPLARNNLEESLSAASRFPSGGTPTVYPNCPNGVDVDGQD